MVNSYEIAKDLLAIEAVQINTNHYFTWTSGIQSPIYCDNRLTMSFPSVRKKIMNGFIEKIEQLNLKPDVIVGCATAGIPHAAWLAEALDLPMVYVRSSPKKHGKGNQIEGKLVQGQKAIVIEDLISTGGSAIDSAKAIQKEGIEILGVLAIFTYGLQRADINFKEALIPYHTLTNFDDLVNVFGKVETLTEEAETNLLSWRDQL